MSNIEIEIPDVQQSLKCPVIILKGLLEIELVFWMDNKKNKTIIKNCYLCYLSMLSFNVVLD